MTTKRWLFMLAGTAIVSITATVFASQALEDEFSVSGSLQFTMRSTVLDENRELFVYLPEDYGADTTVRYPVLYVLDGGWQSFHSAESARLLARIGQIPPMIVVGVPNISDETRNRDFTPPEMPIDADAPTSGMGAADRFLSFLQTELITRVERDYRTTQPRMLAGYSYGGVFVIYSQLAAPSLFDARFAHSPSLWRENDFLVTRMQEKFTSQALPPGFLYLSVGDQESKTMTESFRHAFTVLESHAPSTLRWRADFSSGGTHNSNPQLSTPVGLCALFQVDQPCQGTGIKQLTRQSAAAESSVAASGTARR